MKNMEALTGMFRKSVHREGPLSIFIFFLLLSLVCFAETASARTDIFFMAPVSGQVDSEVSVPLLLKGERLQSGAMDFLYDSRYVSPVFINGNLVKVDRGALANRGAPFFFGAARLDALFDETRPYLRTLRFSFAFQTPVSSTGVEELATFHFQLNSYPPAGITLLQVIKNTPSMADLALYRQGGGIITFETGGILPGVTVDSPENEKRYEETSVLLKATVELAGNSTAEVYWVDPFAISEPLGGEPIVATGNEQTVDFEPGIHALWSFALDNAGNVGSSWTAFGVKEDVIVTVLGEIDVTVIESTSSEPVSGATVILYVDDHIVTSCFTGIDGLCVFDGLEEGQYTVEAKKDFYDGYSKTVSVPKDETVAVTLPILSLVPPSDQVYEYSSVRVCVYEGSTKGNRVSGAGVREIRGSYSCVTGQDGCCYVDRVRRGVDLYWYAENGELFSELTGPVKFSDANEELAIVVNSTSATALRLEAVDPLNSYNAISGLSAVLDDSLSSMERVTDSSGNAVFSPVSSGANYSLTVKTAEKSGPDSTSWYAGQEIKEFGSDLVDGKTLPFRLPFAGLYAALERFTDESVVDPSQNPSMEFYVTDQSDRPMYGVSVTLKQSALQKGPLLTDGNGKLSVDGLLPGDVEVTLSRSGYQAVRMHAVLTAGVKLTRYVKMGEVLSPLVDYQALGGGGGGGSNSTCPAIEITVKNPLTGQPVPGLNVEFTGKISGRTLYAGILDNNGTIMFKNVDLTEIPVDVHVSRPADSGNSTVSWDELNIFSPVVAQEGYLTKYTFYFVPDSTGLEFESSQGGHPLLTEGKFIVKDNTGHAVNNATVTVKSTGDGRTFDLRTDDAGYASFQHDFPGVYHVIVLADGSQGMEFDTVMGIATTYTFNVDLQVVPVIFRPVYEACSGGVAPEPDLKAEFTLTVTDATAGSPASGITARIYDDQGGLVASGVTDDQGKWAITGLDGASSLEVQAAWQSPSGDWTEIQDASFNLIGGSRTLVSLFISPGLSHVSSAQDGGGNTSGKGRIALKTVDARDQAIYRAKITVVDQNGNKIRSIYTNDQGMASVTDLASGQYSILVEADNHVYMGISSVTVWPDSDFKWKATLPDLWNYVKGAAEDSRTSGRLLALVVNGDTFRPLPGVSAQVSSLNKSATGLPATFYTDSYGRLSLDGLDSAGPVNITLGMHSYVERHEGPVQINKGETRYALYALTPEAVYQRVENPDNIPAGRTFWFPGEGRGIVQMGAGMTIFSYDPTLMHVKREGYIALADSSAKMMSAVAMPYIGRDGAMASLVSYLTAVKTGRSSITLYSYSPSSGDAAHEAANITTAGDLYDVWMGYDRLVAATSSGLLFYSLLDENGEISPSLKSSINIPAVKVLGSGRGMFAFTDQGEVASIDASTLEMPVITGRSSTGFIPANGAADWKCLFMEDENGSFHSARVTGSQAFFTSAAGAPVVSTPSLWINGQVQYDLATGVKPRVAMIGEKTFGFIMTSNGLAVVELTDNSMLQVAFYALPSAPGDMVFTTRRIDGSEQACILAFTESGIYSLPMPDAAEDSIHVDMDVAPLLPPGPGPWYAWTSKGYLAGLNKDTDENGDHFSWQAEMPPGVYDLSFVDNRGVARFAFSSLSLFSKIVGDTERLSVSLDLQRSDGSRAASFRPGQEIFVNMGIDVWQDTVADGYLVVRFKPDGKDTEYYCPARIADDGAFEITACMESAEGVVPFKRSWPVAPATDFRKRLVRLPEGEYGGAGMVSFFFTAPGAGSSSQDSVYSRADAPFRITR